MTHHLATRRHFLQTTAATAAGLAATVAPSTLAAKPKEKPGKAKQKRLLKSVKIGMVQVPGTLTEKMAVLKELGFDGIELNSPGGPTPAEAAAAKQETGLPIHGVVDAVHWKQRLSDPSAEVRATGLEALKTAIVASKAYGGSSVLLVPGRVTEDATFDQCWDRSIGEIKKAIPTAEEHGIHILIENVWNDFLTDPKTLAKYLDEIDSKWVGAYFDVGNTVRYSPPHEWIPILGERIIKLDIKDYSTEKRFSAKLLEGDVDWPKVMAALREIDYNGWATAEIRGGPKERLKEIAERMDRIFAS